MHIYRARVIITKKIQRFPHKLVHHFEIVYEKL